MIRAGAATGRAIRRADDALLAEEGLPARVKRAKPDRAEQRLQIACVNFLRRCVPLPPDGPFYTHVPNGGYRTKSEGALLKAMGLRAGVPDLWLLWRGHSIVIEMKSEKGRVSMDQIGAHAELRMSGASVRVVRTPEEFQAVLADFGIPVRGRMQTIGEAAVRVVAEVAAKRGTG